MDLRPLRREREQLARLRTRVQAKEQVVSYLASTLLQESGYSQRQVSRILGFTPAYLSNIRAGRQTASDNLLDRVEERLGAQ